MVCPAILARMIQQHDGTGIGIHGSEVRPLPAIASYASKSEVFGNGCPAVLDGNDVVRLMEVQKVLFLDQTILASPPSALPNDLTNGVG
jgi:hypothetical protein